MFPRVYFPGAFYPPTYFPQSQGSEPPSAGRVDRFDAIGRASGAFSESGTTAGLTATGRASGGFSATGDGDND